MPLCQVEQFILSEVEVQSKLFLMLSSITSKQMIENKQQITDNP